MGCQRDDTKDKLPTQTNQRAVSKESVRFSEVKSYNTLSVLCTKVFLAAVLFLMLAVASKSV